MPGERNNNWPIRGLGLGRHIDIQYAQQNKADKCEEIGNQKLCEILDDSFAGLKYSDVYLYCCINNILDHKWEEARKKINAIISEEANIPTINQCDPWKPDFKYENLCSNYDLTEGEKIYLWFVNGNNKDSGFGLERLYSTTKVFLDVSDSKGLKEAGWSENKDDLLGYYTKTSSSHSGPQVWLIMDNITAEAERLCIDRKYIIAKVYIHEMMHRFFDLRPDLRWKHSVKEIEEPMAEFATLKFIEELSKQSAAFEKLLPIAIVMTEGLRKSEKHFIYALGVDLYYKAPIKLIYDYRRISMLLHRSSEDSKLDGEKLVPSPMKDVEEYELHVGQCKPDQDLQQLVGPIRKCIETYAKFFPLDKGTK